MALSVFQCFNISFFQYFQRSLQRLASLGGRLKGYATRHAGHQMPAFGIEGELRLWLRSTALEIAAQRTCRHIVVEIARFLGLVIDGEHTGIELFVVSVKLLGHPVVEKPILCKGGVFFLRKAPVQLPPRISPQLVETAVERVGQREVTVSATVLHLHELALHEEAVLVQEFHIQHTTHIRGGTFVSAASEDAVPDGVPKEIAGVVHVHEHLLLREALAEAREPVSPPLNRGGRRSSLRRHQQRHTQADEK